MSHADFANFFLHFVIIANPSITLPLSGLVIAGPGGAPIASLSAFAGPAIGAAAGFIIGVLVAEKLGLPGIAGVQMGIGAAIYGGLYGAYLTGVAIVPVFGWIAAAIGALLIGLSFLWGENCESSDVQFTCEPWVPPSGGDDCSFCGVE